jgi:putative tryptophan/tyrosine transport system substrate-binding protein
MKRREFITLLGGAAAAWPLAVRAQQLRMPVIGLLSGGTLKDEEFRVNAFREGLGETAYVEGRNVAFEYRWAENHYDRLPTLAAELVNSQVTLVASLGPTLAALAAKAATTEIPIVFYIGADPIKVGLVSSLNRPGGNVTGVSILYNVIVEKQFEMLHQTVPNPTLIGFLVNPTNSNAASDTNDVQAAANVLGSKLIVVQASADSDLEGAFANFAKQQADAVLIATDTLFRNQVDQLGALAVRHKLPMICSWRECATAGGLMSYGANILESYRQQGTYAGRILKGEKAADLPVVQATRFDLVINLKTAKTLGLTVPLPLLGRADEVIE